MKILVVEDDDTIREGLAAFLKAYDYDVIKAINGKEALDKYKDAHLIILDINLPLINGLEVLKEVRKDSNVPVLILTAYNDEETKISAFTSLADGYIEKPFSLPVLKARVDSLMKKNYEGQSLFTYQDTVVDFNSYTASFKGEIINMNAKEIEVLKCLYDNKGKVLTREQILDLVWKDKDDIPFDRVIDVYIKELRKKLNLDCIKTVRNAGYKLELK